MAGRDITVGGTESGTTSVSLDTQPRRGSHHILGTSNASGAFAITGRPVVGNQYPATIAKFGMSFPATAGTSAQFASDNVVMIYGNAYPRQNGATTSTTIANVDSYETSSFSVSKTNSTNKVFDINYHTFAGQGDDKNYCLFYGAGRNDTNGGRMRIAWGAASAAVVSVFLKDNTLTYPNWTWERTAKVGATFSVQDVPAAPTSVSVVNKSTSSSYYGTFRVRWIPPTDTGGSPNAPLSIDGYRVMIYNTDNQTYDNYSIGYFNTYVSGGTTYTYCDVTLPAYYYIDGYKVFYTYDVYVAAYNSVSTGHNSSFWDYDYPNAHIGAQVVVSGITWSDPFAYIQTKRKNSDYLTANTTSSIYVETPAGSGDVSWTLSGNGGFYKSGTVTQPTSGTTTTNLVSTVGDMQVYEDSGPLVYTLTATNGLGSYSDYSPFPTPDEAPTDNIHTWSAAAGSANGTVVLTLRYSSTPAGSGDNGPTYARIFRGDYTGHKGVRLYSYSETSPSTLTPVYTYTDTGLTPGTTYYYRVYIFNNAGYVTHDITGTPSASPVVTISAAKEGYFIRVTYSIYFPTGSGSGIWSMIRSDGEEIFPDTAIADGETVSTTYLDENTQPSTSYSYTITAKNDKPTATTVTSNSITVPALNAGESTGSIGGNAHSPFTGANAANTDWMSGVTFSSGNTSGAWIDNYPDSGFSTDKVVYVYQATVHFRSGGSGTVQLQMSQNSNPSNANQNGRYYQRTRTSSAAITRDPDTDLTATFNPRSEADERLITSVGQKWYVGFRQISGADVKFYREAGDSGANIIGDNVIYKNGVNVNSDFGTTNENMYVDFVWRSVPSAPLNASASITSVLDSATEVKISWTTPSNMGGYAINGYRILYRPQGDVGDPWETTGKFGNLSTTQYTVTGLEPGTTYEFVVAATNMLTEVINNDTTNNTYTYPDMGDVVGTNSGILTITTDVNTVPYGAKHAFGNKPIITSYSVGNGRATFNTSADHGLGIGDIVSISVDNYFDTVAFNPGTEPYPIDGIYYVKSSSFSTQFVIAYDGTHTIPDPEDPTGTIDVPNVGGPYTVVTPAVNEFTGDGVLNDALFTGLWNLTTDADISVRITETGGPADFFRYSLTDFRLDNGTDIAIIAGTSQYITGGVSVKFNAATGHTVGDTWSCSAIPTFAQRWKTATDIKVRSSSAWNTSPALKVWEGGAWVAKLPYVQAAEPPLTEFTGSGNDDGLFGGTYTGTAETTYYVKIVYAPGGDVGSDAIRWSTDNFATDNGSNITIEAATPITLSQGVVFEFDSDTDHTLGDIWSAEWTPA